MHRMTLGPMALRVAGYAPEVPAGQVGGLVTQAGMASLLAIGCTVLQATPQARVGVLDLSACTFGLTPLQVLAAGYVDRALDSELVIEQINGRPLLSASLLPQAWVVPRAVLDGAHEYAWLAARCGIRREIFVDRHDALAWAHARRPSALRAAIEERQDLESRWAARPPAVEALARSSLA